MTPSLSAHSQNDYGLLYSVVVLIVLVVVAAAVLMFTSKNEPDKVNVTTRKMQFAAATFTGILLLLMFGATLYWVGGSEGSGKEIFEKLVTAITPIAGAIIGYIFGTATSDNSSPRLKE
jgi:hypothetical protein